MELYMALFLACAANVQSDPNVRLRWTVDSPGKAFRVAMNHRKPDEQTVAALVEEVLSLARTLGDRRERTRPMAESVNRMLSSLPGPGESSMTLVLVPVDKDTVSVKLVQRGGVELVDPGQAFQVQLRGEIDSGGKNKSWWLQFTQRNLLSILCELPGEPVKVGDEWSIGTSLVQMGHGFVVERAHRANRVELEKVGLDESGENVASITYVLCDSVEGEFAGVQAGVRHPATLSVAFVGRGEFYVKKGWWKSLKGDMRTFGTGKAKANSLQSIELVPLKEFDAELLKLR